MALAKETAPAAPTNREQLQRYFTAIFTEIDAFLTEEDEEKREDLQEQLQPLCVMQRIAFTIQIAWGGPEYGFKLLYDPESKTWISGVFSWADWFQYDEEPLSPAELEKVVSAYAMDCLVP